MPTEMATLSYTQEYYVISLTWCRYSPHSQHLEPGSARESGDFCRHDPRPGFWMQCRSCQAQVGANLLGKYGRFRAGHAPGFPHRRENPRPSRSPYRTAMLGLSAVAAEWGPGNRTCMCPRRNALASLSAPQGFSSFPTVLGRTFFAPPHHFCAAVPRLFHAVAPLQVPFLRSLFVARRQKRGRRSPHFYHYWAVSGAFPLGQLPSPLY